MKINQTYPLLEGHEVSVLIPQKPPIEMVDSLWYNDESSTISGLTIQPQNIFVQDGVLAEPGILENIAQTAALRVGYMVSLARKESEDVKAPVGYIGAIKKLVIHRKPAVGTKIKTQITIENVVFDVTIIKGYVRQDEELLAECEMKIFLKKD